MNSDEENDALADTDELTEGDLSVDSPTSKISIDKADRSLFDLNRWYNTGRIVIDPEWQRNYVWSISRASKLIESLLLELPIPVIYLAVNTEGKYEVIDGLQRLTSVFKFFRNEYQLTGLEVLRTLNGSTFAQLEQQQQNKLEESTLRTFEIAQSTPKDLLFLIFERLNTGGVALREMEIRNCLFRGPLNSLIKELAGFEPFRKVIAQKDIEKRMDDRAFVLRFLAFHKMKIAGTKKGLKSFFNDFFSTYRNAPEQKLAEFRTAFQHAMKAAFTIFGEKAFRLRRAHKGGGTEWASKANAAIFQAITVSFCEYDLGQLTRSADTISEAYLDLISSDDRWVGCVSKATGDYQKIEYVFSTWQARLKAAVATTKPNDKVRCFSRALKQEMFEADPTCALCKQRISNVLDAALDHHEQYWQGGLTVPKNARLVHRQCNLERPRKEEKA